MNSRICQATFTRENSVGRNYWLCYINTSKILFLAISFACFLTLFIFTNYTFKRFDVIRSPQSVINSYMNRKKVSRTLDHDTFRELTANGWNCSLKSLHFSQRVVDASNETINETAYLVPNVVHYVWPGADLEFKFVHYLSFRGVHRFIAPRYIFVYGETGPSGRWWNRTIKDVDNIIHVYRESKTHAPSGKEFRFKAHDSDVLRTEIILKFGGIYLDGDIMVLKSFDPLRRYQTVMGREAPDSLCNGILISAKNAPFIRMLLEQYNNYTGADEIWAYRSVLFPHILNERHPGMIHVEETSLHRPNWMERSLIYDTLYNWKNNYAIHLWVRMQKGVNVPQSFDDIKCTNNTIGQIARHICYGSSKLLCGQ